MSDIYNKYCKLKKEDKDTLYLFQSGNFYIFIGDDANKINEYVVLKKTFFCKEAEKCGFPLNSLDDYLRVFKNHGLKIKIINKDDTNNNIIDIIKKLDLDNITPIKALNILYDIKKRL